MLFSAVDLSFNVRGTPALPLMLYCFTETCLNLFSSGFICMFVGTTSFSMRTLHLMWILYALPYQIVGVGLFKPVRGTISPLAYNGYVLHWLLFLWVEKQKQTMTVLLPLLALGRYCTQFDCVGRCA
jgi:hypothetical protein